MTSQNRDIAVAAGTLATQAQLLTDLATMGEKIQVRGEVVVMILPKGLLHTAAALEEIANSLLALLDDEDEGEIEPGLTD